MDFKESTFMYILAGAVVAFVLAQSIFFLVRAYKQGKKIGISEKTMKNTIVSSSLFSIAPSISILATIITLSGALGLVLPWIRLTVIGAITYEVPAAESALNALGQIGGLSQEVTDPMQFSTIAWVMTLGSIMPLVLIPFMLKFIQKKVGGVANKNAAWANTMSAAAFIGLISAFIGRAVLGSGEPDQLGDGAGVMSITALAVSMLCMLGFMKLQKKKSITWLEPLAMPLSMFIALAVVTVLSLILPGNIALLEWRG